MVRNLSGNPTYQELVAYPFVEQGTYPLHV